MNRVLFLLVLLCALSWGGLPFVYFAPNRLQSGEALALWTHSWWLAGWLIMLMGVALAWSATAWSAWISQCLAVSALLYLAYCSGSMAQGLSENAGLAARVSLGSAFWCLWLFLTLIMLDAWQKSTNKISILLFPLMGILLIVWWLFHGHFDALSLMKEYQNQQERFQAAWWQHIYLVLAALLPTVVFALPLGWLAWRFTRIGRVILPLLNIIQTIPSIALFAFLMVPLAALAKAYPLLHEWGVSGIGTAPALIALVLYMLLPLVRNTHAALEGVPKAVLQAARGMGMSKIQVFFAILLPLSLPVILSGIRIVLVQSIGLTVIAALIGAGGLGIFVWEGLGEYALDLVLLGAIPTIVMALLADALMQLLVNIKPIKGITK